ncbi:hypothetical protein B0H10DRAFT_1965686 [Mycena sp. CBHHK59/15]|nr:hypothetical protein B0H10DRAFT_1965686 [Mycena sp. CBHHK59/15]
MAKKRLTDHANRPGHLRAREAKQRSLAEKELARQMTASRLGSSGSTAASDPTEDRTTSLGHQSHCPAVFDFEAEEELDEEDAVEVDDGEEGWDCFLDDAADNYEPDYEMDD